MFFIFLSFIYSVSKDVNFWDSMELKQQIFENDDFDYSIQVSRNPFLLLMPVVSGARAISYDSQGRTIGTLIKEVESRTNYLAYYNTTRGFVSLKQDGELNQNIIYYGLDIGVVDENYECSTILILNQESVTLNSDIAAYTKSGNRCLWLVSPSKTTFTITNTNGVELTVYASRGQTYSESSSNYNPDMYTVGTEGLTVETTNIFVKWVNTGNSDPTATITRPAIETTNYVENIHIQVNPLITYSSYLFANNEVEDETTEPHPEPVDPESSTEEGEDIPTFTPSPTPKGLSVGAIVGIALGSVFGAVILICAIIWISIACCC